MQNISRRELLPPAAATLMLVPRRVLGGAGHRAPSDTLTLAGVGVGGVGKAYLRNLAGENIAFLCDVDEDYAAPVFQTYPNAKVYRDFRVMLEKEKSIDGVVIGTPDHTHAVIAMTALQLGKHVYCAKPLTRTIHEARALAKAAREAKVATQMSVQSCASEKACLTAEWVRSGAIGKVREVHVWSDRPIWPQGLQRPARPEPVPASLDWNLWLGPAPHRPYHSAYHPFRFRGWWDFGTGALGDMGCHTLHVIVRALELGHPTSVEATWSDVIRTERVDKDGRSVTRHRRVQFPETYPHAAIVTWCFPARRKWPPVRLTWYDGGLKPPRPPELEPGRSLPKDGILFIGSKGTILSGFTGGPELLPASRNARFRPPKPKLERTIGHYQEWIQACKGGPAANCEFQFGAFLTELTLLGNIAIRTGKCLEWDPVQARITNEPEANQFIQEPYRAGWSL